MAPAKKNDKHGFDLSRRTFLRRSALLVSSVGLGAAMQSSVMDQIIRKARRTYGTALAAQAGIVDYSIEICFRLGFQTNSLFPSAGHARTIGAGAGQRFGPDKLNFYYSPGNVQTVNLGARNLHLARFGYQDPGDGSAVNYGIDNPLAEFAGNIAVSEAIGDNGNFSHTDRWSQRYPNAMAPNPSTMHANLSPNDVPIRGVLWEGGADVDHSPRSGLNALQATVTDDAGFVGLFNELPLPFTLEELEIVVGSFDDATGVLNAPGVQHKLDNLWRNHTRLRNVDQPAAYVNTGRGLSQLSTDLAVQVSDGAGGTIYNPNGTVPGGQTRAANLQELSEAFRYDLVNTDMVAGGVHWGQAMMQIYRAMAAGLIRTAVINVQTADWHTDRPALDGAGKQQLWGAVLTRSLHNFMRFAAETPSAFGEYNMADSMLISLSSEFSRTPFNRGGSDNGDGAAQSCMFVGSHVNGGTLGDIDTLSSNSTIGNQGYGDERVIPFDPSDGSLAPTGQRIGAGSIWKTHMALMGISESDYSSYGVDGSVVPALVRT